MRPNTGVPISLETRIPGWMSDEEEKQLIRFALSVPPSGLIVEIGAEYGRSAGAFLTSCDESVKVVSVDLFPKDHPLVGDLRDAYEDNLTEAGFGERLRASYAQSSEQMAGAWPDMPIDLLFIDGDHTYDGASFDIKTWSRWVRPGGLLLIHDVAKGPGCHPLHYEVQRAITDNLDQSVWILEHRVDSLCVYRRRHVDKDLQQPISGTATEPDERDSDGSTPSTETDASVRVRVRRKPRSSRPLRTPRRRRRS